MLRSSLLFRLLLPTCVLLAGVLASPAQIPDAPDTTSAHYSAKGMTDQPFTVEVLDARRTVSNTLLVRMAVTNQGTAPLRPEHDFSDNSNPMDANTVSSLYAVDPNGQTKYAVLRDAAGRPLCSRVVPAIQPGERRTLYAQLSAPPDTSSSIKIIFPGADPILHVPIGLPEAGEPLPPEAAIGDPGSVPPRSGPAPTTAPAIIAGPTSNNLPNVYTNQTQLVPSGAPLKGIGTIDSGNATVPFTVEVLGLTTTAAGSTLRVAFTNNGSGELDATGQFTPGLGDVGDAKAITGVYLLDPATQQRFQVARASQTQAMCSRIDPAVGPGERRTLEARFPAIPASVKSVYVYFPHTAPISNVPVSR